MIEIIIIINGVRYDAVPEKEIRSCTGCEITRSDAGCILSAICRRRGVIFKKSEKKLEK